MKIRKSTLRASASIGLLALSLLAVSLFGALLDPASVIGQGPTQNVTVLLNVTNTEPTVYDVVVHTPNQDPLTANTVTLTAGGLTEVLCNISASDPNGEEDLHNATADLYALGEDYSTGLHNASHYRNTTCLENYSVGDVDGNNRSLICRFEVYYFAFNSSWICNATVRDFGGTQIPEQRLFLNASDTDDTLFNELVAIESSTDTVDYGNLSVTETSSQGEINITNAGNVQTNFTVMGYGGLNQSLESANFSAMLCEIGNISIGYHRYSNTSGAAWADMINLTGNATHYMDGILGNRTYSNITDQENATLNQTFWRIYVPLSVGGLCNGTIQFAATTSDNGIN